MIAEPSPGALLHEHLVPRVDELAHARGGERDPVLVGLDLGRNANSHYCSSLGLMRQNRPRDER